MGGRYGPGPYDGRSYGTAPHDMECSEREYEVVRHYFDPDVRFNKTEAVRRAGYSFPEKQVHRIFSRPSVRKEITRRRQELDKVVTMKVENVVAELTRVATANPLDYGYIDENGDFQYNLKDTTRDEMAALSEVIVEYDLEKIDGKGMGTKGVKRVKIKPYSKMDALEKLAKHLGMYTEKVDMNVKTDMAKDIMNAKRRVRQKRIEETLEEDV